MKNGSLGGRIALLFAACSVGVSLVAGVLFSQASEAHFLELDQQVLEQRTAGLAALLGRIEGQPQLEPRLPALRDALAQQPDLALRIVGGNGSLWFSSRPGLPALPAKTGLGSLEDGALAYRVWASPLPGSSGATVQLLLDITHHQHFLQHMQRLIWLTMALAAAATALLGGWAARRALAPLRQMGEVAATISATTLGARLPEHALPAELAEVAYTFNAMLARLEEAFARLTGFSADIAHELRTPLTNLLTHTQVTLAQPRSLESYRETLHGNLEELQRLAQLVNDMLLLAKGDHGLLQPGLAPLALAEEVAALLEYYQLLADERGIHLLYSGSAAAPADRPLLRRALSNLLDNALRYTPPGGEVRVALQQVGARAHIEVFNSGPPLDPSQLERLFERFYRASPARASEQGQQHAGLGLAITRAIAQAHGGSLDARNTANGPCFTLQLPVHS